MIGFQVEGESGGELSTDNTEYTEGDGEGKSFEHQGAKDAKGEISAEPTPPDFCGSGDFAAAALATLACFCSNKS